MELRNSGSDRSILTRVFDAPVTRHVLRQLLKPMSRRQGMSDRICERQLGLTVTTIKVASTDNSFDSACFVDLREKAN